jgi:hypothetical protein
MTNLDLLKLPEGEFKITNGNYHHLLKVIQHPKKKKKHLLFIIKPQFGMEKIWLKPKRNDYHTHTWVHISDFSYKSEMDLSKYEIQQE